MDYDAYSPVLGFRCSHHTVWKVQTIQDTFNNMGFDAGEASELADVQRAPRGELREKQDETTPLLLSAPSVSLFL